MIDHDAARALAATALDFDLSAQDDQRLLAHSHFGLARDGLHQRRDLAHVRDGQVPAAARAVHHVHLAHGLAMDVLRALTPAPTTK